MAPRTLASTGRGRRERRASSVGLTSARTRARRAASVVSNTSFALQHRSCLTLEPPPEWPNGQPPAVSAAPPIHAAAPYVPEGYYPVYYPPGTFLPHPHDGQPGPDGSPPQPNGQPMMPYFIHPGGYPPFPHYPPMYPHQGPPPPGAPQPTASAPPAGQQEQQPTTVNPSDTARKPEDAHLGGTAPNGVEASTNGKKRSRTTKTGEPKAKKAKSNGASHRVEAHKGKGDTMSGVIEHQAHIVNGGGDESSG